MNDQTQVNPDSNGALPAGYQLHWYKIQSVLGKGGFGITYLAHDLNLERDVAIKEYFPGDFARREAGTTVLPATDAKKDMYEWGLQRFVAEARTLSKFDHPNIVRVHAVFEENGTGYMVMSFEQGRSLQDLLDQNQTFDERSLLNIVRPLLSGLALVHQNQFIHRDIKPDNIFIRSDGSPALLDFGSARQALSADAADMTVLVTPGYAPVEQYYSSATEQGPWTDIYGLGATLYRAVTGEMLTNAVERSQSQRDLKPLEQGDTSALYAAGYSPRFIQAIDSAINVDATLRPQTVDDWLALLPESASNPVPAGSGGAKPRGAAPWIALGVLALALVIGAGFFLARTSPESTGANDAPVALTPKAASESALEPAIEPALETALQTEPETPRESTTEPPPVDQPVDETPATASSDDPPSESAQVSEQAALLEEKTLKLKAAQQALIDEQKAADARREREAEERRLREAREQQAQRQQAQRQQDIERAVEERIRTTLPELDQRSATTNDDFAFRDASTTRELVPGAGGSATVSVQAKVVGWQSTGARLIKGETYRVTATGIWRMGRGCRKTDASGERTHTLLCVKVGAFPVDHHPAGALIAKLGKERPAFYMGPDFTFVAPESATLYLRSNDPTVFSGDNSGQLEVTVALVAQ